MRLGRIGLALVVAAGMSLPAAGFAQQQGLGRGNGAPIGPKPVQPTYGPNGPDVPGVPNSSGAERAWHQPREVWARNSDPVLAERPNAPGKYYDARPNGERGTLGPAEVAETRTREGLYDQTNGVNIAEWEGASAGAAALEGRIGEYDRNTQNGAAIGGCIACADASVNGGAAITSNGLQATIDAQAGAYIAKVDGNFDARYRGDVVQGGLSGEGSAFIGAQARGTGTLEASLDRVVANGKVDAFVGGRAEGSVSAEAGLTNVGSVKGTATGEISYGLGASAEGYFGFDRTTWTFRVGGRASATLGVGAGVGFETEVSIKPAVDWAAENVIAPAASAISDAASATADWASDTASSIASSVSCFFGGCDEPKPTNRPMAPQQQTGAQASRNQPTGPVAMSTGTIGPNTMGRGGNGGSSGGASGAGTARD